MAPAAPDAHPAAHAAAELGRLQAEAASLKHQINEAVAKMSASAEGADGFASTPASGQAARNAQGAEVPVDRWSAVMQLVGEQKQLQKQIMMLQAKMKGDGH